jgi:hypothetical protein
MTFARASFPLAQVFLNSHHLGLLAEILEALFVFDKMDMTGDSCYISVVGTFHSDTP